MKNFWRKKKVLITGGTGFIGSYVSENLINLGANVSVTSKSGNFKNIAHLKSEINIFRADLSKFESAKKVTKGVDVVLNLASKVAGIQYNIGHPVEMFEENITILKNVLSASYKNNVERFLVVSSACVYPRHCSIPTLETDGFKDDPEPTNLGYGWAKRVGELLGRFYFLEHGFKVAIARPYNAYGPKDNFDPNFSHVIPGLIKRVFDGEDPLVVWGSGRQTRSFIYADDFARGLIETIEKYPKADPVNIGSSKEVTIGDLAKLIIKISGKNSAIKFDKSKPDGQPRRACNVKKAKSKIGFRAKISLEEGLKRTIEWYKQH